MGDGRGGGGVTKVQHVYMFIVRWVQRHSTFVHKL